MLDVRTATEAEIVRFPWADALIPHEAAELAQKLTNEQDPATACPSPSPQAQPANRNGVDRGEDKITMNNMVRLWNVLDSRECRMLHK